MFPSPNPTNTSTKNPFASIPSDRQQPTTNDPHLNSPFAKLSDTQDCRILLAGHGTSGFPSTPLKTVHEMPSEISASYNAKEPPPNNATFNPQMPFEAPKWPGQTQQTLLPGSGKDPKKNASPVTRSDGADRRLRHHHGGSGGVVRSGGLGVTITRDNRGQASETRVVEGEMDVDMEEAD